MLLLIATLTTLMHWLLGIAAAARGLAAQFQANTERRRAVLSLVFLGQQLFSHPNERLDELALNQAFQRLRYLVRDAVPA